MLFRYAFDRFFITIIANVVFKIVPDSKLSMLSDLISATSETN